MKKVREVGNMWFVCSVCFEVECRRRRREEKDIGDDTSGRRCRWSGRALGDHVPPSGCSEAKCANHCRIDQCIIVLKDTRKPDAPS
jgi:hypothetical protein